MLKDISDLYLGKTVSSPQEEAFIRLVKEKYGITIVETNFVEGTTQSSLRLYADLSRSDDPTSKMLYQALKPMGTPLMMDGYSSQIQALAGDLLKDYAACFALEEIEWYGAVVYMDDYIDSIRDHAHGHAEREMALRLKEQFLFDPCYVIVFYEPAITIFCEDETTYTFMKENEAAIRAIGIEAVKKHDHRGVLCDDDVCVKILLKQEMQQNLVNAYMREVASRSATYRQLEDEEQAKKTAPKDLLKLSIIHFMVAAFCLALAGVQLVALLGGGGSGFKPLAYIVFVAWMVLGVSFLYRAIKELVSRAKIVKKSVDHTDNAS